MKKKLQQRDKHLAQLRRRRLRAEEVKAALRKAKRSQ